MKISDTAESPGPLRRANSDVDTAITQARPRNAHGSHAPTRLPTARLSFSQPKRNVGGVDRRPHYADEIPAERLELHLAPQAASELRDDVLCVVATPVEAVIHSALNSGAQWPECRDD